eukprot:gene12376-6294_t
MKLEELTKPTTPDFGPTPIITPFLLFGIGIINNPAFLGMFGKFQSALGKFKSLFPPQLFAPPPHPTRRRVASHTRPGMSALRAPSSIGCSEGCIRTAKDRALPQDRATTNARRERFQFHSSGVAKAALGVRYLRDTVAAQHAVRAYNGNLEHKMSPDAARSYPPAPGIARPNRPPPPHGRPPPPPPHRPPPAAVVAADDEGYRHPSEREQERGRRRE